MYDASPPYAKDVSLLGHVSARPFFPGKKGGGDEEKNDNDANERPKEEATPITNRAFCSSTTIRACVCALRGGKETLHLGPQAATFPRERGLFRAMAMGRAVVYCTRTQGWMRAMSPVNPRHARRTDCLSPFAPDCAPLHSAPTFHGRRMHCRCLFPPFPGASSA